MNNIIPFPSAGGPSTTRPQFIELRPQDLEKIRLDAEIARLVSGEQARPVMGSPQNFDEFPDNYGRRIWRHSA